MLVFDHQKSNGDTLIEVLFATAVFSLIAVGGLSIMNKGTAASQRALEITLVRNEIDSQAEVLRFLNASYIAAYAPGITDYGDTPAGQWYTMVADIKATANAQISNFANLNACPANPPNGSFIMNTHNAKFITDANKLVPSQTFAQTRYDVADNFTNAEGIWIEAVRSATVNSNNQSSAGYVDFSIRACWDSPGQDMPVTIGTLVRLYEPR
jgi:type II secretory pathway pseudopilin PulG